MGLRRPGQSAFSPGCNVSRFAIKTARTISLSLAPASLSSGRSPAGVAASGHDLPFGELDLRHHGPCGDAGRATSAGVDLAALQRTRSYTYGNANLNQDPTPARPRRGSAPYRNWLREDRRAVAR
jgi:hypothetical protein